MAMKPALTLRMGQQLKMTPQLQQAIRLLQLSTIDLQQEIQEALDSNPMLEEVSADEAGDEETSLDSPDHDTGEPESASPDEPASSQESNASETDNNSDADYVIEHDEVAPIEPQVDGDVIPDASDQLASDHIAEEMPVDSVWEDFYDDSLVTPQYTGEDDDTNYIDTRNSIAGNIHTHLLEQVNLLPISDTDQIIAMAIIDALDDDGVLTVEPEDLLDSFPPELDVELDEVIAVLHLIQHLDPVGIAARNLSECLEIQLRALPESTPFRNPAIAVVSQYINQLGNRDFAYLMRKLKLKENDLKEVIDLIQTLNPRPGADVVSTNTEYIEPDVIVSRNNDRWKVELNPATAPRIRVNPGYASMVKRADSSSDNTYLKNNLQEARWFIKSLQQRNDTLLRVSTKIVEFQRGFFEYGEEAMKPLVLHDIADAVDLHESTISRVTTQKYMHTPNGVFELKYFFSSHVSTQSGGEVSSTAIRALIKKLVAEENPKKPLSDSKIAKILEDQDINVARRTIAKYRESLMIPPSNERKQLI